MYLKNGIIGQITYVHWEAGAQLASPSLALRLQCSCYTTGAEAEPSKMALPRFTSIELDPPMAISSSCWDLLAAANLLLFALARVNPIARSIGLQQFFFQGFLKDFPLICTTSQIEECNNKSQGIYGSMKY